MVRSQLLVDLVKEVLGPRKGPNEILPEEQDPRNEFITGVLAPAHSDSRTIEGGEDLPGGAEEGEDDQHDEGQITANVLSPALDPKAQPSVIGLSFTASSEVGAPEIEVCTTWARYHSAGEGGWKREPNHNLTGFFDASSEIEREVADGVSLQTQVEELESGELRISAFLLNKTEIPDEERPQTGDFLFQPQIRVNCGEHTDLVPVRQKPEGSSDSAFAREEESLTFLYRQRTAYARGHLCGAIWEAIDPESPHPQLDEFESAPFKWTDAECVPESKRQLFVAPDARTELVPCYPVQAPFMDWRKEVGEAPTLNTEELSETWNPGDLREALSPIADGYEAWIDSCLDSTGNFSEKEQEIAIRHLEQCGRTLERIRDAIDVLCEDKDARLSFCFANRAIALQSEWDGGNAITWRPFQLAFILLNIPAVEDPFHSDREICDLLWFPTGGGKTEAYLGLAAFTLALRRIRAEETEIGDDTGAGTSILSRYTLRLLTIQQFRRALGLITACECLRVKNLDQKEGLAGWRPDNSQISDHFLWGDKRFSAGLWVGGGVTPNRMKTITVKNTNGSFRKIVGAIDILRGARPGYDGPDEELKEELSGYNIEAQGEPAQVLDCPCCGASLAVPEGEQGLGPGRHQIHFVFTGTDIVEPSIRDIRPSDLPIVLDRIDLTENRSEKSWTVSLSFEVKEECKIKGNNVDNWWYDDIRKELGSQVDLASVRPARPGYYLTGYTNTQGNEKKSGFEIYCPNPACELNSHMWAERVPLNRGAEKVPDSGTSVIHRLPSSPNHAELPDKEDEFWQDCLEPFHGDLKGWLSTRIPVPGSTVDEQVYHHPPSLVIATVDKFARLAFEPKAASLFGNVSHYHSRWGYYRESVPPSWGRLPDSPRPHPPGGSGDKDLHKQVDKFRPPDLILQDELHLIKGPLGSMVGLYESAIDELCSRKVEGKDRSPKYIASTATTRQAGPQVKALYDRKLSVFPPWGIESSDRFFSYNEEIHPLDAERPGQLYVAVSAPGKGAQTPIVRIWSSLLQSAYERWEEADTEDEKEKADRFQTLVGYFNAIRELAGARSLYRQDIPERMKFRFGDDRRPIWQDRTIELSSRADSMELPSLLEQLGQEAPNSQDVAYSTSMFGTGVDKGRLSLMVVHGQPKTTASYIQATGRVGREKGGLVVSFFRASRPRDLDHYEFFTGYHRALHKHIEPITVAPFSPQARERSFGPLAVAMLRNAEELRGNSVDQRLGIEQRITGGYHSEARLMEDRRYSEEVEVIPEILEERARKQPEGRRPSSGKAKEEAISSLDRWAALSSQHSDPDRLVYYESSMLKQPSRHVVLGDEQHSVHDLQVAFQNTPNSLREVESTLTFQT